MTIFQIILIPISVIILLLIVFSIVFGPTIKRSLLKKRLLKEGLSGTGTLVNVRETNVKINNAVVMELTLNIKTNLGETWQAKVKQPITLFQARSLNPGAIFNILYDANDKNKVVLNNI